MARNMLLAAADQVAAASTTLPTSEIGSVLPGRHFVSGVGAGSVPGWSVIEAQTLERIPVEALRWPRSIWTYEDMRRDSQIQGLLQSVFLPIRHMEWYVDPTGTTGTVAEEIAEDFGLPLLNDSADPEDGPGINFNEHLRLALLPLARGHGFFEESGIIEGTGSNARYRLRRLEERPPHSLVRINVAPNGDLLSVWQHGVPIAEIPAERLLAYVWDREGGNWAGRPLLYGIYRNWLLKDQLVRADAVKHTRFNGVPIVETTDPNVGPEAHAEAAKMAQLLQSGQGAGAATPYGTRLHLLGVEGSLPDTIASVNYHDQQMARAFMQMFAELGNTAHGSRALGTTLLDHYSLGVLAIAHWARRTMMQLVRRIVVRNYGPDMVVPKIKFRQDDREDITSQDLVALIDAGAIVVDDDLEATIRDRSNLPPRNPDELGREVPGKTSQLPAARRGHRDRRPTAADAPSPAEQAQTDFVALQAAYLTAISELKKQWAAINSAQIDDLVAQVKAAKTTGDLAAITAKVEDVAPLLPALRTVLEHGAQSAVDEATAQGATLAFPSLATAETKVTAAAWATGTLLARSLADSAASKAVALSGGELTAEEIGDQVREHLEGLSGAAIDYEFAGLVTKAQNTGRFTAMQGAPDGTRFYSSELNDERECEPCAEEDGTEFASLDDATNDYPSGGYVGCEGGNRCRGTIVATYAEAAPSA